MQFEQLFQKATGNAPYPYQTRLATGDSLPELLDIPTGCGKTAAVVLAWIWRRRFASEEIKKKTPRRLVYCLPMRVLVEQTRDNAIIWLKNLGLLGDEARIKDGKVDEYKPLWDDPNKINVTVLMGGEDADEWDLFPERDAIIIGTQDMLLSRALNRGYGMSRYRWPIQFGLLNNDCFWVMDEVQLMGVGLETTAQMDAFRKLLKTYGSSSSLWMSATQDPERLKTVDAKQFLKISYKLEEPDRNLPEVQKRLCAVKTVLKTEFILDKETNKNYPKILAELISEKHIPGTFTLVILNSVSRAQETYQQLKKRSKNKGTVLLHSRFRPQDRDRTLKIINTETDLIAISTQVVEAGVDISARTLISELAPWSSMVQRFGRCNRKGEFGQANVYWIDIDTSDGNLFNPYDSTDLVWAREKLTDINNADILTLEKIVTSEDKKIRPVIRKKDLLDLFDTTSDLTGTDLDVSQYIRESENIDVHVYWRDVGEEKPDVDISKPSREELCPVLIENARKFFEKKTGYIFDHLEKKWMTVGRGLDHVQPRPGMMILIPSSEGGYYDEEGWIGLDGKDSVDPIPIPGFEPNAAMSDDEDYRNDIHWVQLYNHCKGVSDEAKRIAVLLNMDSGIKEAISTAGFWHDVGKSHPAFQNMLKKRSTPPTANDLWAKSDINDRNPDYFVSENEKRPYFRHELASALAWLQLGPEGTFKDLITYLVGSHHGKVRLSIRSLPNENEPNEPERLFARGVWHGDELPIIGNILYSPIKLDLTPMLLGEGSWIERSLKERDRHGPFVLGFYESILRASDRKISSEGR
jgi:CRISPR-associated endonuclease/helicase Cas3